METNINISNINRHFLNDKPQKIQINYRNKIVNYSYFSVNEATICHKIKKIPYYSNFFSLLEDYEALSISQLNADIVEKLENTENNQYFLFKYKDKNAIEFLDFLYDFTCIKKLISSNIDAFQHILQGLRVLNDNNICFFDITPKKILFLEKYREKPVLSNFRFSLNLKKLDYTYISHILNKLDDFTYQPMEIHILYYIVKQNMKTISYAFIEEFCEDFIKNLHVLRIFSENYRTKYKELCIETMRKYINRTQKEIVDDILERNNKWDVYGISMLFLHIFGSISRVFSLNDTFVSKITLELTRNLHPDPDKRMSLEETLIMFNKYLNDEPAWIYVNKLDNNKLPKLFDELSK